MKYCWCWFSLILLFSLILYIVRFNVMILNIMKFQFCHIAHPYLQYIVEHSSAKCAYSSRASGYFLLCVFQGDGILMHII